MTVCVNELHLKSFKAYGQQEQVIGTSAINLFMGANNSGKSTCLQSLLALKQTLEGKQSDVDILLNGKYTALGTLTDVIYKEAQEEPHLAEEEKEFSLGVIIKEAEESEGSQDGLRLTWHYTRNENKFNKIGLKCLELQSDAKKIELQLNSNGTFDAMLEDRPVPIRFQMENLLVKDVLVDFDVEYNRKLLEMLKDVTRWAAGTEKIPLQLNYNDLATNQLETFKAALDTDRFYSFDNLDSQNFELSFKIVSQFYDMFHKLDKSLSDEFIRSFFINILFYSKGKLADLKILTENYVKKFSETKYNTAKEIKTARLPFVVYCRQRGQDKSDQTYIRGVLEKYNSFIKDFFKNIRYLGPLREPPKSFYEWSVGTDPEYVGARGQFFTAVLANCNQKVIDTTLSLTGNIQRCTLRDALQYWCEYLDVAHRVDVNAEKTFGITVQVANVKNKIADIMNVGAGTSQVIPVLLMGLLSPKDAVLIYEQPELHLHPYSQSRLADFFIAMAKMGKQVIIETHSEYMLHRLRYQLAIDTIKSDQVQVSFFENQKEGTFVYKADLEQQGAINYPKNFKDQSQLLMHDILRAAARKILQE